MHGLGCEWYRSILPSLWENFALGKKYIKWGNHCRTACWKPNPLLSLNWLEKALRFYRVLCTHFQHSWLPFRMHFHQSMTRAFCLQFSLHEICALAFYVMGKLDLFFWHFVIRCIYKCKDFHLNIFLYCTFTYKVLQNKICS